MTTIQPAADAAATTSATHLRRRALMRAALLAALLTAMAVQPVPLRLVEITRATRSADSAEAALPLLLEGYRRQSWNPGRAEAAGYGALLTGDFELAVTLFSEAAARGEWTPALHRAAGDAYHSAGNTVAAIEHWQAALVAQPDDKDLLVRLSTVYESEGRYAEAADVLERLTLGQPTDAALHYRLGIILAVTDPAAAREHLALASGLDPSFRAATDALDAAINYALATDDPAAGAGLIGYTLVNLEQYGLAEVALQSAIELDPDYADAYAYLGLSADRRGGDGLQQYEQALALDPDSALAHTLTGIYWKQHGDQARALAELTRANELDPLNAAISAELAGVHAARADLTAAEEWYLNAVRLAPNDTTFWTLLARFYLDYDFKAIEQGLPAARTATEHGPIYAPAHDALGHALVVAGRADEAESALLRALELDPEYAPAYFHLGLAYLELDRQDDAVRSLQTALTLDPDGPTGNRALNTLARLPADGG